MNKRNMNMLDKTRTYVHPEFTSQKIAGKWLEEQIQRSKKCPFALVVTINTHLANALLVHNKENRNIMDISALKKDLTEGHMVLNGQAIIMSVTGELNDGQHRCQAVVETNTFYETVLVFGVTRASRKTLDGRPHTSAQLYKTTVTKNEKTIVATTKMWLEYKRNEHVSDRNSSPIGKTEIVREASANSLIAVSVDFTYPITHKTIRNDSLIAFFHYLISRISPKEVANDFIERLCSGSNLPPKSPILYARTALMDKKKKEGNRVKAELLFKCWNAFVSGESVTRLSLTGETLPSLKSSY